MPVKKARRVPTKDELLSVLEDAGTTVKRIAGSGGARIGKLITARDGRGYLTVKINGCQIGVHRALWIMRNGPIPEGAHIDHIDGDQLNNKAGNLRLVTPAENTWNRRLHSNNKSGVKGVCWSAAAGKWQAAICDGNGRDVYLGQYEDKQDAVRVVQMVRSSLHGTYANHGSLSDPADSVTLPASNFGWPYPPHSPSPGF